jgi:hypothetical protein
MIDMMEIQKDQIINNIFLPPLTSTTQFFLEKCFFLVCVCVCVCVYVCVCILIK